MNLIKYLSFLLPWLIVGCETTVGLNIDEVVTSNTESLSFLADGEEDVIEFDIPCDWEASISEEADWLTLNRYSGNSGRNYINITAEDNKSLEAREAVITIYNDIYEVSKEVTVYQEANDPYITLSNNVLEFDKNKSSKSIEVESSIPWSATIVSNPDWLTITPSKGDNGTTTLKVTVKGNNTIDFRSANIKIENSEYKLSKVLTISQSAGDATASVSSKEISIPSEGDTKSIGIESNTPWKAKCNAEWISLSPTSGSKGKTTMSVSAKENPYAESRTATITIVDNKQKELAKINVKQGGSSAYINLSNNSIVVKFNIPYTLNIESTVTWAAEYDADIVSVTPNSGIGKVDATITIIDQTTDSVDVRFYNNNYSVSTTLHITPDYTNCIFYTSSDGIVSPSRSYGFDATIISNEIINGIGAITFNNSVTTIGDRAFEDCLSLTSVTIPDSVTTIGYAAFDGCSSLTSVTIGDSVTEIGNSAFSGCTSLTSVTIPDSVTTIGNDAFYGCSSLTSVTIGDSVTTIGENAFEDCLSLTSVTIPDSVTTIGYAAFNGCSSLTSVTIGDSVTEIGNSAFSWCESLTSVTIGDSVTTIGFAAFYNCSSLESVTIPDSVTTIGSWAFNDCSSLTSVTIPDSVTSIENEAFENCSSLTSVYCEAITPPAGSYDMFYNNASGRKIYVPMESVEAYKSATYWNEYKSSIVGYDFENGVVVTPKPANNEIWYTNGSMTEATTPYKTGVFGKNIVSNTYDAAKECWVIKFDGKVTSIGTEAFANCGLTSVTIPNSVTTIGNCAFMYCSSITSVTIPDSVTEIGYYAFYDCSSLTSVYCKATTPPSVLLYNGYWDAFFLNAPDRKIYVPMESVETYKWLSYWKEYKSYIVGYNF